MPDPVTELTDLLNDNWDSSNVPEPRISESWQQQEFNIARSKAKSIIIAYSPTAATRTAQGISYPAFDEEEVVRLQIRTKYGDKEQGRARASNLFTEVQRIIHSNRKGTTNYDYLLMETIADEAEEWRNVFGYNIRVTLHRKSVTI